MKTTEPNTPDPIETRKNFLSGLLIGALIGVAAGIAQKSILIGIVIGIPISVVIGFVLDRRLPLMKFPTSIFRRILFSIILFVVSLNSILFLPAVVIAQWGILLYILSVFAWLLTVIFIIQAVASLDEMQRRIQTEAIAIGFACTAIFAMAYGIAGLVFEISSLNWIFLLIVMVICWLIGKVWTLRRYGS